MLKKYNEELWLRLILNEPDYFDINDLVDVENLSLNFLREISDTINCNVLFEKKYLTAQIEEMKKFKGRKTYNRKFSLSFEEFCKTINEQFYNEYFKNKEI